MGVVYKAGGFSVPGGTGNFSVSGLGFTSRCNGVIFFGTNQATEDAVVTDGNAGAFMGIMVDTGGGGVLSESVSIIPTKGQVASGSKPILMQLRFNVIEYAATGVSLDTSGFTVNFTSVAANRWIHYLAWGDADGYAGFVNSSTNLVTPVGFQAKTMFHVGTLSSGGGIGDWIRPDLPGYTFGWYGGAAHSGIGITDASSLSLTRYPFTGQIATRLYTDEGTISVGAGFIGPFVTEVNHGGFPSSATDYNSGFSGGYSNMGLLGVWDGDADAGHVTPSSAGGGISTHSIVMDTADAMLFMGAAGWQTGPGVGSSGQALGFGVWTPDYEGCVMVNESGNYLFQSRVKSWCSNATAAGANAGTTTSTPGSGQFELHTVDAGAGAEGLAWLAWINLETEWLPQIYRWFKGLPQVLRET